MGINQKDDLNTDQNGTPAKETDGDAYRREFGITAENTLDHGVLKRAERALDHALDIRKFEIGLYWQRAAYFWTLIAAAFAGYFAILNAEHLDDKAYLAYILSCVGGLFTWAWFLVNRGSKLWQENWENHVDMLEDAVTGPLYKTILHRPAPEGPRERLSRFFTGPEFFSVSKIHQWVSLFTLCIWGVLIVHVVPLRLTYDFRDISLKHAVVGGLTILFAALMHIFGKTSLEPHEHVRTRRQTFIRD